MKTVLVIGAIGEDILSALSKASFEVITAEDSEEGLRQLYQIHPNAVIMADSLPKVDGKELQARMRELCDLPIIVLGREKEELVRAMKMESGADIYLNEGVRHPELIARLHSLLRRRERGSKSQGCGSGGELEQRTSRRGNGHGDLTSIELHLLSCLVFNENRLVPHSQLVSEVWCGKPVSRDCLEFHIRRLRHKLRLALASPGYILNQRGVGYRFCRTM